MPSCARLWNASRKRLPIPLPSGRFSTRALCPGNPMIGEYKMLKRIASTGVNLVVLGVSVAIFLMAFFALNALGTAQRPPTVSVLSATHDLNIGDVITPTDLAVKTVFKDDNASLYIPGEEVAGVVGGVVAQPIFNGQPVFRSAIVAQAAEETRLSAVLAKS